MLFKNNINSLKINCLEYFKIMVTQIQMYGIMNIKL